LTINKIRDNPVLVYTFSRKAERNITMTIDIGFKKKHHKGGKKK